MALVLVISTGFLLPKAAAQSDQYSKIASVDQYLMERNAEILMAQIDHYAIETSHLAPAITAPQHK